MALPQPLPPTEIRYLWKVLIERDGRKELLTPHGDPYEYEYPFDFLYDTPDLAVEGLKEAIEDEQVEADEVANWFLCQETVEPISRYDAGASK